MADHSNEAAIRARAYELWVESGYAHGLDEEHWRQAEAELGGATEEGKSAGHAGEVGSDHSEAGSTEGTIVP